jgi:hypothetical protein
MAMKTFASGERLFATDLNDNFDETTKAGNVTSGTFDAARIPGLDASKITTGKIAQARLPMKKIARFTGNGTFTPPAGVTYAIAHMRGGGGGTSDNNNNAGQGGNSSVAFASGTVTATGGNRAAASLGVNAGTNGRANTSEGGTSFRGDVPHTPHGITASLFVAGAAVTPGVGISVVVGAGGAAGTNGNSGGSGYVWIEYYE